MTRRSQPGRKSTPGVPRSQAGTPWAAALRELARQLARVNTAGVWLLVCEPGRKKGRVGCGIATLTDPPPSHGSLRRKTRITAQFPIPGKRIIGELSALGHDSRMRMLIELAAADPVGHNVLQLCTGLAAGPLYHHLKQLQVAGLLRKRSRDAYQLTARGRYWVSMICAWCNTGF